MAETDQSRADAEGATWHASGNCGPRRHGGGPSLVVLHYTAMHSAKAALERLCDPAPPDDLAPVSAHYLICPQGRIWQMVREGDRAWHAGAGNWAGCADVNSHSIGIELANDGASPFAAAQMDALERLLTGIMGRWAIPPTGVIGHSDMAPGRKIDPGPRFDWKRLAHAGLAIWPGVSGRGDNAGNDANHTTPLEATAGASAEPTHTAFAADLAAIGYRLPEGADDPDALMLDTFRQHFRPWGRGALETGDARAARWIAEHVQSRRGVS